VPELRKDPVTGRWVIIASDRGMRPSDFIREHVVPHESHTCPFCPGNEHKTPPEILAYRPGGGPANGPGWTLRVVSNKFPALRVEGELNRQGEGLYDRMNGIGAHEVLIETPEHMLTLGELPEKQIADILWAFRDRVLDLKRDFRLVYIIIFKNHGEAAGASLEHPHSQLIALPVVPKRAKEEMDGARRYFDYKERCIFCDIIRQELETTGRVILETDHYLVLSPYASRFPFETWIIPKRHSAHFEATEPASIQNLGWVERAVLRKIDKVLERPAYNMMIHSAPIQEGEMAHYHWHIEIIPKLTRVAGFEWGTGFYINPTPPELAAKFLRDAGLV
jgi:UDPglucose--hexose-1-phosphate uridylyltransferase